ncbi:MAG TPA: amidohydrolase family protein, partial [Polyangiaceae bacterium]|nr:amidohydrolase family protein [Polyangiaceae bacterium]
MRSLLASAILCLAGCVGHAAMGPSTGAIPTPVDTAAPPLSVGALADSWRAAHRLIDLHTHVDSTPEHMSQAIRVLDAVGIGVAVNLSGGTVTHSPGQSSDMERTKALADQRFPGRFLEYMNLDYAGWDTPDFAKGAVAQVEEGFRLGAAGFKEFKRLGLFLRDGRGRLVKIDDPKLDPMWRRLGELGMPVSIHVADPKAFWGPYDPSNERWTELKDHPSWWFGDRSKYPSREELLAALERVVTRHPETTFVCVHFANNAEDLDWVDAQLTAHPNMMADIAARVPEIGRHAPERVRALFVK